MTSTEPPSPRVPPRDTDSDRGGEAEASGADVVDVVVIGGGLVGSVAATMLCRRGLSVRTLEARTSDQPQKTVVGEAITEGSSLFLRHEMGLDDWLAEHTFRKFGFDFLMLPANHGPDTQIDDCHELLLSLTPLEKIPKALERLIPTYHVDRAELNVEASRRAQEAGVDVEFDAAVQRVELGRFDQRPHRVIYRSGSTPGGREKVISARWVLDCSGRRRVLARQLGITSSDESLPTAAVWNRFEGVDANPKTWTTFRGVDRRRHTVHFSGKGFWIWWIHQDDGQTSVGVSYDKRQHQPDVKAEDRGFAEMIAKCPPAAAALRGAKAREPFQYLAHLPYRCEHWVSTRGYALIGDASWFADAVYSTSLETAFRQLMAIVPIIERHRGRRGDARPCAETLAHLNEEFEWLQRSAIAHNRFKYEHAWHSPHTFFQVALYELSEIAELYHLQPKIKWRPDVLGRHYRLQWGSKRRYDALVRFMESARRDAKRDHSGSLLKKSLSPGGLIYSATWPLWQSPAATPYFFVLTKAWGYAERAAQRIPPWPDLLALMATPERPSVLFRPRVSRRGSQPRVSAGV